jgi:uncharacterized protein (DUF885 family)
LNEELTRLGDEYWEYHLSVNPTTALMMGDHRYDDQMEDASREAEDAHIARLRSFAATAEAIAPTTLTPDEVISREVLIFVTTAEAEADETRLSEVDVNPAVGLHVMLGVSASQFPITEPEHAEAMLEKYAGIARLFDQMGVRLQEGVANGRTPPDEHVDAVLGQIDAYLESPLDDDPLVQLRAPEAFDENAVAAWRNQLGEAVTNEIRPAFQRYRDVIANDVRPAARLIDQPGLSYLADGESVYARAVHRHTSLGMDPREVHEIGRRQIQQLEDEYRTIGAEALGTDDVKEIYSRMRGDASLHFDTGPEVVAASEVAMARAKGEMANWFGRLPEADCVVSETHSGPTAYYFRPAVDGSRPGTFFVNTADPTRWGRFEIEAMAYHEGIPGHHLQLAISGELPDTPMFRKHAHITAYSEGWGLYSERLADEMGLYQTPLDRIGMLSADSMRAGRLVIDTGLHSLGWSKQEAMDYFASNSPMSLSTIEGEVDRYIGMPGQALAYMIGRLEIMRIRSSAETRMGASFDIKGFHDTVIGSGLVPLETLDRMVDDWSSQ